MTISGQGLDLQMTNQQAGVCNGEIFPKLVNGFTVIEPSCVKLRARDTVRLVITQIKGDMQSD